MHMVEITLRFPSRKFFFVITKKARFFFLGGVREIYNLWEELTDVAS